MNTTTAPAAASPLAPLREAWRKLAPRERQLVLAAAIVIGLALLWLVAVAPAWRTLRSAPAELESLDLQLQQMQRLAAESKELRALPPVPAGAGGAALQAATGRLGPKARLSLQGDRAVLTLQGVPGDALKAWLAEARSAARGRPVEAQLTRTPNGFNGTVVVALGGRP